MIYILIAVISLLIAIWFYTGSTPSLTRGWKLGFILLRTISIAVVLLYLFNPILRFIRKQTILSQAVVLIDDSDSMDGFLGESTKQTQLSPVKKDLINLLKQHGYEVNDFTFADGINGKTNQTQISKSLNDLASKLNIDNVEEIFLLSDGWFHDDSLNDISLLNKKVNCYIPQINTSDDSLQISFVEFNNTSYINEKSPFIVHLNNAVNTKKLTCIMSIGGKEVLRKNTSSNSELSSQFEFDYSFKNLGIKRVTFEVIGSEGDNSLYSSATVRVISSKNRVLLVTDALNWETKQIKDAVKNNSRFDLDILQTKNRRFYSGRDLIQSPLKEIDYSLLILVNNGNLTFTREDQTTIRDKVINGKSAILIGAPISGLRDVQPLKKTNMTRNFESTISITNEGKEYTALIDLANNTDKIPPLSYQYYGPENGATILANFNNSDLSPAIALKKTGAGTFLNFATKNLWKWSLWGEDNSYQTTFEALFNWLSSNQTKSFILSSSKPGYLYGEKVLLELQAFDEKMDRMYGLNPEVNIYDNKGKLVTHKYMVSKDEYYSTSLEGLVSGEYTANVSIEDKEALSEESFLVLEAGLENSNKGYNAENLKYISAITNGAVFINVKDIDLKEATERKLTRDYEIHLYKKIWLLAVFLAVFSTELLLRRRKGLL